MGKYKGIILAGGKATRLYPITRGVCKQLLPVYDKPMIYYPLSTLMLAGIRDILLITTPHDEASFRRCLGDGKDLGINIEYAQQASPNGLAEALLIGEKFIGDSHVCLVLGDNIFYGHDLQSMLHRAMASSGATVFAYSVKDPERYGVVEFDKDEKVVSIEEKPLVPRSRWAVTGVYFFDRQAVEISRNIKPSPRGELEITDVLRQYLLKGQLNVVPLGRGYAWLDAGTYESLIDSSLFIKTIEDRQDLKIGCIEEIAYFKGFISRDQLLMLADGFKTSYGEYLRKVAGDH
ncbi:MAG: glucose-1-phosphate thymidylyltransferase RfbA [Candidatus Omnitrophica bacterium]|nr:glucose-1-phosphate thymidylyltransferase RfbA [Candidatus Omnitrophota bacterium]